MFLNRQLDYKMLSKKKEFPTAEDIEREYPSFSISIRSIRRRLGQGKLKTRRPDKKPFISK